MIGLVIVLWQLYRFAFGFSSMTADQGFALGVACFIEITIEGIIALVVFNIEPGDNNE